MFALWARPSQDLQKALQLLTGLAESTAAANRLHAISIFPEYHMELHLISIASLKPWFLSKLHGASAGLKIAIPLPDTTPLHS
ncbi:Plakophilin-2 [Trichinella spiralis]|uniref:Plakophilin-2 n=1 Tax=Trichinella spiralis TaxID=6334 RepID=A0ABR3K2E5_TRISP